MIRYLLTRLLTAVPVILGVVSLTFVMMYMLPGDPASTMLAKSGASAQQIAELRAELGLDRPLYVQYFQYLFNVLTGEQKKAPSNAPSYTRVFADSLIAEAAKDDKICAVTAAMPDGTGLNLFAERYPSRCFDVGIAEQTGHNPAEHGAVFQRVAGPRRRLTAVTDHHPLTAAVPDQIGRMENQLMLTGQANTITGPQEAGVAEDQSRRNHFITNQGPRTVEVSQNQIQQLGTLAQRVFDVFPFATGENHWQQVELPGVADIELVAGAVAGAIIAKNPLGGLLAFLQR